MKLLSCLVLILISSLLNSPAQTNDPSGAPPTSAEMLTNAAAMKVLLEAARVKATNLLEWAKRDFERMGTWRYRVITFKPNEASDEHVEGRMNELGREGWECFWVRERGTDLTMFFRKAEKSTISEALKYRP
jgi:hypothetical protein